MTDAWAIFDEEMSALEREQNWRERRDQRQSRGRRNRQPPATLPQNEGYRPPAVMDPNVQGTFDPDPVRRTGIDFANDPRAVQRLGRLQAEEQGAAAGERAADRFSPLNPDWGLLDLGAGFATTAGRTFSDEMLGAVDPAAQRRAIERGEVLERGARRLGENIDQAIVSDATIGDLMDGMAEGDEARREAGEPAPDLVDMLWRGPALHARQSRAEGVRRDALADYEARESAIREARGEPSFGIGERVEREMSDRAFADDLATTGSGVLEFIPGLRVADIPIDIARFGARQGVQALGREVPELLRAPVRQPLVGPARFDETQPLGPLSAAGREFARRDVPIAGGIGAIGAGLADDAFEDEGIDGTTLDEVAAPVIGTALGVASARQLPRARAFIDDLPGAAAAGRYGQDYLIGGLQGNAVGTPIGVGIGAALANEDDLGDSLTSPEALAGGLAGYKLGGWAGSARRIGQRIADERAGGRVVARRATESGPEVLDGEFSVVDEAADARVYRPNRYTEVTINPDGEIELRYQGGFVSGAGDARAAGTGAEGVQAMRGALQALEEDIATTGRAQYHWTPGDDRLADFYRQAMQTRTPRGYVFEEGADGVMTLRRENARQATPAIGEDVLDNLPPTERAPQPSGVGQSAVAGAIGGGVGAEALFGGEAEASEGEGPLDDAMIPILGAGGGAAALAAFTRGRGARGGRRIGEAADSVGMSGGRPPPEGPDASRSNPGSVGSMEGEVSLPGRELAAPPRPFGAEEYREYRRLAAKERTPEEHARMVQLSADMDAWQREAGLTWDIFGNPVFNPRTEPRNVTPTAGPDGSRSTAEQFPLRGFHGTGRDIQQLRDGELFWISETPDLANEYAAMRGAEPEWALRPGQPAPAPNVVPVRYRIGSEFDADAMPDRATTVEDFLNEAAAQAEAAGRPVDRALIAERTDQIRQAARVEESGPHYSRHDFWYDPRNHFGNNGAALLRQTLQDLGFDGVRLTERGSVTHGVFPHNTNLGSKRPTARRSTDDTALAIGAGAAGIGAGLALSGGKAEAQEGSPELAQVRARIQQTQDRLDAFERALESGDPEAIKRMQRLMNVPDDGVIGNQTRTAASAELPALRGTLEELRQQEAYLSTRPTQQQLDDRHNLPTYALIGGAVAGHVAHFPGKWFNRGANALRNRAMNRSVARAGSSEERAASMNAIYDRGGAPADELPYRLGENGQFSPNRNIAAETDLFRPRSPVAPYLSEGDMLLGTAAIGEVGITGGIVLPEKERELEAAREALEAEKTTENYQRVEDLENEVAQLRAMQRAGLGFLGGQISRGVGSAALREPTYERPRPDWAMIQTERATLNRQLRTEAQAARRAQTQANAQAQAVRAEAQARRAQAQAERMAAQERSARARAEQAQAQAARAEAQARRAEAQAETARLRAQERAARERRRRKRPPPSES